MKTTCPHVERVTDVGEGEDVCETCIEVGGTWHSLRQCLVCGRTGCCDSSPNRHATAHFRETGHEVIRTLEPGQEWSWCNVCELTLRQVGGGWVTVDTFFEAGLWFAQQLADEVGRVSPEPGEATPEGFPIGDWAATYRGRRLDGTIDPEQVDALEALPGWTWEGVPKAS